jgi:hypothetical protein
MATAHAPGRGLAARWGDPPVEIAGARGISAGADLRLRLGE